LLASPGTTPPGAPSYSFTGDTDSGLFQQSVGTLALDTNGTARLTVTGNGNIGVGKTTAAVKMDIAGSINADLDYWINGADIMAVSGSKLIVGDIGSNNMSVGILANGAERVTVDTTGYVGIGTITPKSILDVSATGTGKSAIIIPRDTTAGRPAIGAAAVNGMIRYNTNTNKFEGFENGAWTNFIGAASVTYPLLANPGTTPPGAPSYSFNADSDTGLFQQATGTLALGTNGTSRLTVDASGNIGIGTATPGERLHVVSSGLQPLYLESTTGSSFVRFIAAGGTGYVGYTNQGSGGMSFWDNTGSVTTLIATNSGQIGIGTQTPAAMLDVTATGTAKSAIIVPRDTTAGRPAAGVAAVNGMIRYNTNNNKFEAFENGSWTNMIGGGGGSPGGANTQIQFNNSGSFGGSSNFVWDNTNNVLTITGDIQYSGVLTDTSDRRLKRDIQPLTGSDVMDRLTKVNTYSFRMKEPANAPVEFGVMAQEVQELFPELVKTKNDEMHSLSVNYMGFIAPLIETSRQLKTQNEELRSELNEQRWELRIMMALFAIGAIVLIVRSRPRRENPAHKRADESKNDKRSA
jgi:hypothetical protein